MFSGEIVGGGSGAEEPGADNLVALNKGDVQVLAAESFRIAAKSASSPVWSTSYHRFDAINPQIGLARQEVVDSFIVPYESDPDLAQSQRHILSKSVMAGAGTVAITLSRLNALKAEIKKLPSEAIADRLIDAFTLTDRKNTHELNQVIGEIKSDSPAYAFIFDFLRNKTTERNGLNSVVGAGYSVKSGLYVEGFRRPGIMLALAAAGALGLTEKLEVPGANVNKVIRADMPRRIIPFDASYQPFNRYDFNVEDYFMPGSNSLFIFQDLTDRFYEDNANQNSVHLQSFSEVCFGALNSLNSSRQISQAIENIDRELLGSVLAQSYLRAAEVSWVIDEASVDYYMNTPLPEDLVAATKPTKADEEDQVVINSVNNILLFKNLLDSIVSAIITEIKYNDNTVGQTNAMLHAAIAVALVIYRSSELQSHVIRIEPDE
ncbi:MAG TPA: hypothetical protein VFN31_00120 [Candidatus Saccharimonadales bacterium]|nr:hypothetical protein [Candidatus Saccharimonadales bacterium]